MEQQRATKDPFPALPIHVDPLPGYLRTAPKSSPVNYARVSQRFLYHELDRCPQSLQRQLRNNSSSVNTRLQQQLAELVAELGDVELDENFESNQPWQQPQLSWLGNVQLQQVQADGPGSRAYRPDLHLTAVVPTKDLLKYSVVGLYLGYVLDHDKYESDVPAAEREFLRYQYDFTVSDSMGKGMDRQDSEQSQVFSFLVDASSCLEGNPLAHLLDYRAFKDGWVVDEQRSSTANAMLLPFSDNSSGCVYVAVLTLREVTVASGEDLCIDYGEPYWDIKRDHDSYLQLAKQQCSREQHRDLKQQLKQQADQLIRHQTGETALKHQLQQLLAASSATVLALKGQPTVDKLADAVCAATMVMGNHEEAVAAAVAAVVGAQVQDELNKAADHIAGASKRHAATVQGLQQQLQEGDAAASSLRQELQQLRHEVKKRDAIASHMQLARRRLHERLQQQEAAAAIALQQQLQEKDAAASALEQLLQQQKAAASSLEQQLQERDAAAQQERRQLARRLKEQDAFITHLRQQRQWLQQRLQQQKVAASALQQQVQEKESQVSDLQQQQRARAVRSAQQHGATVRALQQQHATRVQGLQQQLADRDAAVRNLQQQLQEQDAAVSNLQQQYAVMIEGVRQEFHPAVELRDGDAAPLEQQQQQQEEEEEDVSVPEGHGASDSAPTTPTHDASAGAEAQAEADTAAMAGGSDADQQPAKRLKTRHSQPAGLSPAAGL